jgi:hypothetical protein
MFGTPYDIKNPLPTLQRKRLLILQVCIYAWSRASNIQDDTFLSSLILLVKIATNIGRTHTEFHTVLPPAYTKHIEREKSNMNYFRAFIRIIIILLAIAAASYWGYPEAVKYYNYFTVESRILKVPGFDELKEFYPELYAQIIADTKVAILKGGDIDTIISDNGESIAALLQTDLPLASRESTVGFIKLFISTVEKAGRTNPQCCVDMINGDEHCMWALMSPEEQNQTLKAIAAIIRSAHTKPEKLENVKKAKSDVGRISSDVVAKYGPDIDYTAQSPLTEEEKKKVCLAIADLYKGTLKLPPPRSVDAIKFLLAGSGDEQQSQQQQQQQ